MTTGCGCDTRVSTWADGFGRWHAAVPDTSDGARVARAAIRAELKARDAIGAGYRLTVTPGSLVGPSTCHPRRDYIEA